MPIITFSKSRRLVWVLAGVHGLTLLVIWLLPVALLWRFVGSSLLAASFIFYSLRDVYQTMGHSIVALKCLADHRLELQNKQGDWIVASLRPGSFVAPYLTTLVYCPEQKFFHRYLIILPDMLDAELFRQLRMHLRWKSP
jgi:toxin CptA